jgi:hypothetical protein
METETREEAKMKRWTIQAQEGAVVITDRGLHDKFYLIHYQDVSFQCPKEWLSFHCGLDMFNALDSEDNQTLFMLNIQSPEIPETIANIRLSFSEYTQVASDPLWKKVTTFEEFSREDLFLD